MYQVPSFEQQGARQDPASHRTPATYTAARENVNRLKMELSQPDGARCVQARGHTCHCAKCVKKIARLYANPYEELRKQSSALFLNDAPSKLMEVDAREGLLKNAAKICAASPGDDKIIKVMLLGEAPGGFTEFVQRCCLQRIEDSGHEPRPRESAPFCGLSHVECLIGTKVVSGSRGDFQRVRFSRFQSAVPTETSFAWLGENAGDLLLPSTWRELRDIASKWTDKEGTHLVLADGAWEVEEGKYHLQELQMLPLILSEGAIGISSLALGGDMMIKIFRSECPSTMCILWWLTEHFTSVRIVKPLTSRPSNDERYVVFKHLRCRPTEEEVEFWRSVVTELCSVPVPERTDLGALAERVPQLHSKLSVPMRFLNIVCKGNADHLDLQEKCLNNYVRCIELLGQRFNRRRVEQSMPSMQADTVEHIIKGWGLKCTCAEEDCHNLERVFGGQKCRAHASRKRCKTSYEELEVSEDKRSRKRWARSGCLENVLRERDSTGTLWYGDDS